MDEAPSAAPAALSIFVADDDQFAGMVLESLITSLDCSATLFESGEECLFAFKEETFRASPCHILLLDMELGDMTGIEVLNQLNNDDRPWISGLRIIMVSGHAPDDDTIQLLRERGVHDYWEKPVSIEQLRTLRDDHAAVLSSVTS
mmetsp:Transcript_23819/g.60902  ORF Transcript_23819/g.60902 Transcript_23819/m.60902 type:complete len:146 (+) Transcript_23819:45-482(+)